MMIFESKRGTEGVSEVLGSVIIALIIIAGTAILLFYGLPTIEDTQNKIRMRNIVSQLSSVSEQIDKVCMGVSPVTSVKIALSGGSLQVSQDNNFAIRVYNSSGLIYEMSEPLGKIEYLYRSSSGVYENGGVWVDEFLVTPPKFYYSNGALTIKLIKITGTGSAGGMGFADLYLRLNSSEVRKFYTAGYVEMTISSEYAEEWLRFFRNMNATVSGNTITLNFTSLTISKYVISVGM